MSSSNPIGNKPKDPYEGYKVEAVEKEKLAKEEHKREEVRNRPLLIGAYLLLLFHRILDLFSEKKEKRISSDIQKEVRENLLLLKAAFEILKTEDRSQDIEFLNRLSLLWNELIEESLQFKRSGPFSTAFRSFLQQLQEYPKNQEHTLGYYLTQYAGEQWLPFPYMELIGKIHREHEADPINSHLASWTTQIDQLASILTPQ